MFSKYVIKTLHMFLVWCLYQLFTEIKCKHQSFKIQDSEGSFLLFCLFVKSIFITFYQKLFLQICKSTLDNTNETQVEFYHMQINDQSNHLLQERDSLSSSSSSSSSSLPFNIKILKRVLQQNSVCILALYLLVWDLGQVTCLPEPPASSSV